MPDPGYRDERVLKAECPQCGKIVRALTHCPYCDEWVPMRAALEEEDDERGSDD